MFLQSCNIAAVEYDLSGCRARLAADHIKRRGFARAVGTDQASQFALANRKMQAGNGKKAAEVDSNVTQFENSHRLVSSHPARILVRLGAGRAEVPDRCSVFGARPSGIMSIRPMSPRGRNSTTAMKSAPIMRVQVSKNAGVSERLPCTPVTMIAPNADPSSE